MSWPVLLDDDAIEPGAEEDAHDDAPEGAGADDDAGDLGLGEVSSRHGHAELGSNGEVGGGGDDGTDHAEQETPF